IRSSTVRQRLGRTRVGRYLGEAESGRRCGGATEEPASWFGRLYVEHRCILLWKGDLKTPGAGRHIRCTLPRRWKYRRRLRSVLKDAIRLCASGRELNRCNANLPCAHSPRFPEQALGPFNEATLGRTPACSRRRP